MKRYDLVYSPYFHGAGIGPKEHGKYCVYADTVQRERELMQALQDMCELFEAGLGDYENADFYPAWNNAQAVMARGVQSEN